MNAGNPWTEEEHKMFLIGLQKLGKGDWRGIARNYVVSRTPTQVASHAQKYFLRQSNVSRRKRRSSLFDMLPDLVITFFNIPLNPERRLFSFYLSFLYPFVCFFKD
jgi:SHAQKYF class myb-like DNA-binding protein